MVPVSTVGFMSDSICASVLLERLQTAKRLSGRSARDLDRLAGHSEGHFTKILDRLRASPDATVAWETVTDYARALGIDLNWLAGFGGLEPTHESVGAALRTISTSNVEAA